MHCQRRLAQQVVEQSADYVLALKGNKESLNWDVRLFRDNPATPLSQSTQVKKGTDALRGAPPASAMI